jgi:long-chain fatty acid transport protein
MSFPRPARWLAALAICAPTATAAAQGFGLSEIGTCALSRGFAVTGAVCQDASTIFWNPAATAELDGRTISAGASTIVLSGHFREDSTGKTYPSNIQPALVPSLFAAVRHGRASFGFGVYVPYGLTSQWKDDFPGRFSALRASLQTIYYQPNIAYQLSDNWSIGGGPVLGHSTVDLTQAIDLSQQVASVVNGTPITFGQLGIASQTEFARAKLHGNANGVGYNVGIHGRYGAWSIGARYLSSVEMKYDGAKATFTQTPTGLILAQNSPLQPAGGPVVPIALDAVLSAQFAPGGALVAQGGKSKITHPWQAQGGIGYSGFAGTTLSADVGRLGWSKFNTLPVTFNGPAAAKSRTLIEDYQDSWTYRFGAEHKVQSAGTFHNWTGRVGYSYAETPAPDVTVTPLLPDQNRRNASVGLGIPLGSMYTLDAGYLHVSTPGRRGRIVERTSEAQTAAMLNTGTYDLKADVFSLSFTAHF